MKNPLLKRVPRELKGDIGKYTALFLFLTLMISFVSGFLVADNSMKKAYDDSFEKYSIENGHFTLSEKADSAFFDDICEKYGISVHELFYKNKENPDGHTVRFYKIRDEVNRADIMEGRLPEKRGEIAIDRLYAENNGISVGDEYTADGKDYKLVGTVALSDYSALFKNNTDMMFDANKFTVALVTEKEFDSLSDIGMQWNYAWLNNDTSLSDDEQEALADDIMHEIALKAPETGNSITDFVSRQKNQAIQFTGKDMGGDSVMVHTLLYIVMVVLAFAFGVTARSTIEQESTAIGTLRASGYTRSELLGHYIALPLIVTVAAAIVGNIIGYTGMKFIVADMYYHSYSLPTYKTLWNPSAFMSTTVIPILIIFIVDLIIIRTSLSLSPLQFIRRDLSKKKNRKVIKLPDWKFLTRFRTRVILQNRSAYATLFVGILFASVLLMFGLMFTPLVTHFKKQVVDSKFADFQYVMKAPVPTASEDAEKYCVATLDNSKDEEITIYGVQEDSAYVTAKSFERGKIYLSDGYMEKYGVKKGDKVKLHDKFTDKEYSFEITERYDYPASLCIFMNMSDWQEMFGTGSDYFTGYFSNSRLDDIDESMIASVITEHDLTIMADQLEDSLGMIFPMFGGFAVLVYILMIYLLAKLIIEKNAQSISMVKILGYSDKEASGLYSHATAIVVMLSMVLSAPISLFLIKFIYYTMMQEYSGWLTYWVAPWISPAMIGIGAACYFCVSFVLMKRIRRIELSLALKNIE